MSLHLFAAFQHNQHQDILDNQFLGASVRNPARGKDHEEGSLTKRKGVIRLQGFPLEFPEHPPPKK